MTAATKRRLYVAKDSISGIRNDGTPFVRNPRDEPLPDDDDRVQRYRDQFTEWQPVEQATAAPGEKRNR